MTQELNPLTLPLQGRQLIEASAGTGKTYNITRLYIRLLLETDYHVQNILVMTFTNAATQELRLRLDKELRVAIQQWQPNATKPDAFYAALVAQYSRETATLKLQRALQDLDEAAVFTIHGFCKKVLADQAFESGLRFDAGLDTQLDQLYMQVVQDWYRRIAQAPEFLLIAEKWANPEAFYQAFQDAIKSIEPVVLPYQSVDPQPINWMASWAEERDGFVAKQVNNRKAENIRANWQAIVDRLDTGAQIAPDSPETQSLFIQLQREKDFKDAKKREFYPQLYLASVQAIALANRALAQAVEQGILWCRGALKEAKQRQNVMDFDDLIQILATQLQSGEQGVRLADAVAMQYPVTLVDEFQDTDTLQYSIFDGISRSAHAQLLVMIGDPKQAIYAFRGGDVFAYLQARHSADQQWHMGTNYRSVPGVVAGYNALFAGNPFDFGIDYHPVAAAVSDTQNLQDPLSHQSDQAAQAAQWVVFQGDKENKSAQYSIAEWTVDEIVRLQTDCQLGAPEHRGVSASDIAILVANKDQAGVMKTALARRGIDAVYLSNRETIWSRIEASQFLVFLKGVDQPADKRAMTAALATHWFGLTPEQLHQLSEDDDYHSQWRLRLEKLRAQWQQHGLLSMAFKVVQQFYQQQGNEPDRQLTNDLQLLELAQQESANKSDSRELILWVAQQLRLNARSSELRLESDDDLVRIVTHHGAKGLEYPVVFLPFVSYGIERKQVSQLVNIHASSDQSSMRVVLPDADQLAREKREQNAELVRLLYVAATRAKQRLYVVSAPFKSFNLSPLGLLLGIDSPLDARDAFARLNVGAIIDVAMPFSPRGDRVTNQSAPMTLSTRQFQGRIERDWWLSSFTALTRNKRHEGLSQPERDSGIDSTDTESPTTPSVRFQLPKGAQSGNLLHAVFEQVDFQRPRWSVVNQHMQLAYPQLLVDVCPDGDYTDMNRWFEDILAAPLNQAGMHLGALSRQQLLRETEFYFPMAVSGHQHNQLAGFLASQRGGPVILPSEHRLKGMMHGFIDLIFEQDGRYYLADYKSNWLGDSVEQYHRSAMHQAMVDHYYDLQYWIYLLALHRYCRTHVPDYDPQQHLGGVYYLFLRGMDTSGEHGVYFQPVDVPALNHLDALFAGNANPQSGGAQ